MPIITQSHAIDALQSDVALEERGAGGDGIFGFLKFLKKKPNATSAEGVPSGELSTMLSACDETAVLIHWSLHRRTDSTILARGEALENPAKKPWSRKRKALVTTGALAGSVGIGLGIGYGVDAAIELSRKGD